MESINVINGTGKVSREKINILLDAAMKFYGPKYESVVLSVVRDTLIYEMGPHEHISRVIQNVSECLPKLYGKKPKACHLSLGIIDNHPLDVIIWKPKNHDGDYSILAHELYGHGVCGRKKSIVSNKYQRNGIALYDLKTRKNKLELLNEGFMEVIAKGIIKRTNKNMVNYSSKNYSLARKSASYIWKILGKETVLDDLIEYHATIEKQYNEGIDSNSLILFDHLLQQQRRMKKIQKVCPMASKVLEQRVKGELVKFKQRRSKIK